MTVLKKRDKSLNKLAQEIVTRPIYLPIQSHSLKIDIGGILSRKYLLIRRVFLASPYNPEAIQCELTNY